jgi:hypothetical protein
MSDAAIQHVRQEMNRLRGELFSMLEAMGLEDKQEAGGKRLIRHITYDTQHELEATIRRNGAD